MATEYKHIGVTRYGNLKTANKCFIEERIKTARRTADALMGAGFHGHNGLNPKVTMSIYNLYVVPRLLIGLETVILLQKDIENLNDFHKDILRRIQNLPQRTALPIVYGLVGQFAIELFGNFIREECIEKYLVIQQLAIKDNNSYSWFIKIKKDLHKYGLPNPYELLENPPLNTPGREQLKKNWLNIGKNIWFVKQCKLFH